MTASSGIECAYAERHAVLRKIASNLESFISELFIDLPRVDRISCRAKTLSSFLHKSQKQSAGRLRYKDPITEIQDQIGARITVFYLQDVKVITNKVHEYFKHIEQQDKEPSNEAEFGYFGVHFILRLPDDVIDDDAIGHAPEFFELQVKTLFQHAWSEAHHDLGYKGDRSLDRDERRSLALTAAQAWGADKLFSDLVRKWSSNDNED